MTPPTVVAGGVVAATAVVAAVDWNAVAPVAVVLGTAWGAWLTFRKDKGAVEALSQSTAASSVVAGQQSIIVALREDSKRYRDQLIAVEDKLADVRSENRDLVHEVGSFKAAVEACHVANARHEETISRLAAVVDVLKARLAELAPPP